MGDKNRITHNYMDACVEGLIETVDTPTFKKAINWFTEHPAYYGMSINPAGNAWHGQRLKAGKENEKNNKRPHGR